MHQTESFPQVSNSIRKRAEGTDNDDKSFSHFAVETGGFAGDEQ